MEYLVSYPPSLPRLVVRAGPRPPVAVDIPHGRSLLGRDPAAIITIDDVDASRRHAELARDGVRILLRDLGSTNGTWVNGCRLIGSHELEPGDVVRIGNVHLDFRMESGRPGTAGIANSFGVVHGPVNAGGGDQYNAQSQYVSHGDQYIAGNTRVEINAADDPWGELWRGTGPGRVLMVCGTLIAIAGFVLFAWTTSFAPGPAWPAEREIIPGVPTLGVAFAAFLGGMLLTVTGAGMSKAARLRDHRRRDHR